MYKTLSHSDFVMSADWQTDTCVALEVKSMVKKEFDSIEQALDHIESLCLGTRSEISALFEGSLSRWTIGLTPYSITEDSLLHDCSIKFKESCYNSDLNASECHDDKLLGRCRNAPEGSLSQVYGMGSGAQTERKSLSEDILWGLRNSPVSHNMEEGCFGSKCLRGVLENNEISVGRIMQSASVIVE